MPRNVTLVRFDPANARESIYEVLFIDSGSVTERMPAHWANAYFPIWSSDGIFPVVFAVHVSYMSYDTVLMPVHPLKHRSFIDFICGER